MKKAEKKSTSKKINIAPQPLSLSRVMAELMSLELHYPSNWAYEGTVDILYVDGASEKSYGTLVQGGTHTQQTFPGHRWHVRERTSRELLAVITAERPAAGGAGMPQVVTIGGADAGERDPLRAALWQMGKSPHERLLPAVATLNKIVSNVLKEPSQPKFRSLRAANDKVAAALNVPGALAFLGCAGFEQSYVDGEARLASPRAARRRPSRQRPRSCAGSTRCSGLPPPAESLSSMQASAASASTAASAAASAAAEQPSHRCASCGRGIENDLRRKLAGSGEIGGWRSHAWNGEGAEYRFHCGRCGVDLCSQCYDKWKGGDAAVHGLSCSFAIEAPITTAWGGSNYGPPPAPPAYNPSRRRGPWG